MTSTHAPVSRRAGALALGAALALLASAGPASGHTEIVSSSPAAGAVVKRVPATMTLTFGATLGRVESMKLSRNFSGNLVKTARLDPRAAQRVIITLKRPGAKKQAGLYRLSWRVSAPDGHPMQGVIAFRVRPSR